MSETSVQEPEEETGLYLYVQSVLDLITHDQMFRLQYQHIFLDRYGSPTQFYGSNKGHKLYS